MLKYSDFVELLETDDILNEMSKIASLPIKKNKKTNESDIGIHIFKMSKGGGQDEHGDPHIHIVKGKITTNNTGIKFVLKNLKDDEG